jgi:type I restriction enzyme S subunit
MRFISEDQHASLKKGHIRTGDVLLVTRGSLGLTARVTSDFNDANINAQLVLLRADNQTIDARFLYFLVSSRDFFESVRSFASGTAQPQLPIGALTKIPLSIPPFEIQRKIASILSAYDDLIENNTRRIAILEEMAQAIYREWFVNFRFPGHENVKLVDSPLGQIPEGWEVVKLAEIADVNARSLKKGSVPDNINYIDIASVSTGRIDEIRPMPFSESPGRARRIVRHGDVIWSTVRPVRRSYSIILDPLPDTIASTGFAVLSAKIVPFPYVYFATTTDEFATYLVNHATGSAYPAVNGKDFENADVILPPPNILAQFDNAVGDMLMLGHRLLVKNINLRTTRDLLLPKLISGKLNVEDLDIDLGMTAEALEEATA